jgi:hypothetical protein
MYGYIHNVPFSRFDTFPFQLIHYKNIQGTAGETVYFQEKYETVGVYRDF